MEVKVGNDITRRKEEEIPKSPAWMVTFSDLATLLLTFFVLLLSMSSMDNKTLRSMFSSFSAGAGSGLLFFKDYSEIARPKLVLIQGLQEVLKDAFVIKKEEETSKDVPAPREDNTFEEAGNSLVFENIRGGFKLVFGQKLLFPTNSAEIGPQMKPVLKKIGSFMRNSEYQIYIDGHTDNVPIRGGRYSSNAELSFARAYNLMEYFVNQEEVSPLSIAIAGYGETHPVDSQDTMEGRSRNRRVEIIFKNQKYF
jgi:chemotaxis protein MotB